MSNCPNNPEGKPAHAWLGTGLDNIDADRLTPRPTRNVDAGNIVLCSTRRCVYCGTEQAKFYGDGGSKPWRTVKAVAA